MKRLSQTICFSLSVLWLASACQLGGPEAVIKKFYRALEKGNLEEAVSLLSSRITETLGEEKIKTGLAEAAREMQQKGGVKSLEITQMNVTGEIADAQVKLKYGNGSIDTEKVRLIKEKGRWKIDVDK